MAATDKYQPAMIQHRLSESLDAYLFECIGRLLSPDEDMARTIGRLLGLSRSTAYRRLEGDTPLTTDEVLLLARHFGLSLDTFTHTQSGRVLLEAPAMARPVSAPLDFLKGLSGLLQQALSLPSPRLYYATLEVPLFHYLQFPELLAFKLHVWGRTTWHLPQYRKQKFSLKGLAPDGPENQLRKLCFEHYCRLPSHEYWQISILDNTLNQIESLADQRGFVEPEAPRILLEELLHMIDCQEEMAETGQKFRNYPATEERGGAPLTLYFNEMMHTGNVFLLRSETLQRVYFTFDNPNFMYSQQPDFCQHTMQWFERLQQHSPRISGEGARVRKRFFERLRSRVRRSM